MKIDRLSLMLVLLGIWLFVPTMVLGPILVLFLAFLFEFGLLFEDILTLALYFLPPFVIIDGVVIAIKRRKQANTLIALVLGSIGFVIGVVLFVSQLISIL